MGLIRWLALLLTAMPLFAGAAETTSAVRAPLLWRVEGEVQVYLFGTIHIPDPRVTRLHPAVDQAFAESDVLMTELKMDMTTMSAAAQAMMLPANQKLSNLLTREQRVQLETELLAIHPQLKLARFERLKPWALATQLAVLPIQLKHPGVPALDVQLTQRAEGEGKATDALEQLQEQLGIFDGLTPSDQAQLLSESLDGLAKARLTGVSLIEQLTDAYLSGDEQQIERFLQAVQGENKALNDRLAKALIDDRNRTMVTRLLAKMKAQPEQRFFVAVGAAHLTGPTSLVVLLRKQGYQVTRIRD